MELERGLTHGCFYHADNNPGNFGLGTARVSIGMDGHFRSVSPTCNSNEYNEIRRVIYPSSLFPYRHCTNVAACDCHTNHTAHTGTGWTSETGYLWRNGPGSHSLSCETRKRATRNLRPLVALFLVEYYCCTFSPGRAGRNCPLSLIKTKWLSCTFTIISSFPSPLTSLKVSVTTANSCPGPT